MSMEEARREVADASRILAAQGVVDAFGHISRRSPGDPGRFLISRSLAPAQVTTADVVELDLDGVEVDAKGTRLFLERFIHGEIYRLRPDVMAVAHSHALAVLPFAVTPSVPVRPICHMCGFLHGTPLAFDVADHAGPASDLLIGDRRLGLALAQHLGGASAVLMRGHGFTCVGGSVAQATFRAIYTAKNCEIQAAAMALGEPVYLTEGEAAACEATMAGVLDRAWNLWRAALQRRRADGGQDEAE
jgi:ribulose-5-phosphate 4-epimerase/fuculose-1-phosphate aldolase